MTLVHANGIAVRRQNLIRYAAHEAGLQPAARQHVDHGHFLGHADWLSAVRDRIAKDQQAGLPAQTRQCRQHQWSGGIDTGRGLVMLVEHDLHALVFGDQPFLDKAIIERGAFFRVVNAIGQRDADRRVALSRRQVGIGRFR